jgi:drug/metabolite transporter (DMT)-like permease
VPFFIAMAWWAGRGKPALTRADWWGVLGLGFSGYYISSFLDFLGLQYISASLERLILYLNPTLVLILGWVLYKRKITSRQAVAMAVSYSGVLLVFGHEVSLEGENVSLGALLVLGSAITYAIYLSYSGQLVQRLGSPALGWVGHHGGVFFLHSSVCVAQTDVGVECGARGDMAVYVECNSLHSLAGTHGDDGH